MSSSVAVEKSSDPKDAAASAPPGDAEQAYNPNRLRKGRYDEVKMSMAVPFLPRPTHLDGSHAGDYGFDPLGLSQEFDLYYMQECELRHARLAMLAVLGWPMAELVSPKGLLTESGCAPSILNGFTFASGASVVVVFGALGAFEYLTSLRKGSESALSAKHKEDYADIWEYGVAGDYGFDPLNLYNSLGDDPAGRKGIREVEITQGRLAMLGITAFAFIEKVTGTPIVKSHDMFFHPNLFLPVLGLAYFIVSNIYEVSDVTQYPIKLQFKAGGEETLRVLKSQVDKPISFVKDKLG